MSRLFLVSHRVTPPGAPVVSDLAAALQRELARRGGGWLGWSGRVGEDTAVHARRAGGATYATLHLSEREHAEYYNGFANRTLWPLFHFRPSLVDFRRAHWDAYVAVNARFADYLAGELRDTDSVWVHDYHLIPLAQLLRERGVAARLGFFLHTPLPPPELLRMLPVDRELIAALGSYDLVGFQTQSDRRAFLEMMQGDAVDRAVATSCRTGVFPVGVDPERVARDANDAARSPAGTELTRSLDGRSLAIGVDRLDYSQGLAERFRAWQILLDRHPALHRAVTMLEIASPVREGVPEYRRVRRELEGLSASINGRHGAPDWTALRYLRRRYPAAQLPGFYRQARVGLATPLRDGMNLMAKEYVAAQDPADPGALVLSRFAGAAHELEGALLVNPHDVEGMAETIADAFALTRAERKERWQSLQRAVCGATAADWCSHFLAALEEPPCTTLRLSA